MDLLQSGKRDYKKKIIQFLTEIDPVALTSDEETVLARWEFADRLMRAKEPATSIVDQLQKTFSVSASTAHNDMYAAMDVFGRSRKLNKSYLLHHHLDRIDRMVEKIKVMWDSPTYIPTEKEIAAVARLHDSYTYALNSLPQQSDRANMPPPVMLFKGLNGTTIATNMSLDDALHYADDIINGKIPGDEQQPAE